MRLYPVAKSDCSFCYTIQHEPDKHLPFFSDSAVLLRPRTGGVSEHHFLVVPTMHVTDALDSPGWAASSVYWSAQYARENEWTDFNLILNTGRLATQTQPHIHWHLIRRFEGDAITLPWS